MQEFRCKFYFFEFSVCTYILVHIFVKICKHYHFLMEFNADTSHLSVLNFDFIAIGVQSSLWPPSQFFLLIRTLPVFRGIFKTVLPVWLAILRRAIWQARNSQFSSIQRSPLKKKSNHLIILIKIKFLPKYNQQMNWTSTHRPNFFKIIF